MTPVLHHVAGEGEGEVLERAGKTVWTPQQIGRRYGGRRSRPGAADTNLRVAVHRAKDRHRLAHARLDRADSEPDQRLGARPAARAVHVEVEPDAHVVCERGRGRRVAAVIAEHPVDVLRSQARVADRVEDGLSGERPCAAARSAGVVRLADTDDAVPVLEIAVHLHLLDLRATQSTVSQTPSLVGVETDGNRGGAGRRDHPGLLHGMCRRDWDIASALLPAEHRGGGKVGGGNGRV